ncbi:Vi polysaccharide biosynthesis UDP-N-acetylglucosamine C-6 dehydrogenase TviB [Geothrix mesophila]|uniref:Vi polysaccharide biosynthesis UDP-N-acetylglucosamine C-6 dehydrogenase TviB n=1 Tax=Geothrix mesophila TaxID=2922723 RepID=UPI002435F930|nr:Vi polysaccharide biosynthesis UDP-N-acetylglucosamine C-6 dehydrogenase TviB [Geothrix sp. SG198]
MKPVLGIIGLGYVGLPMAVEFGKAFDTIGFDVNSQRIEDLRQGLDRTLEVVPEQLAAATRLKVTTDLEALRACTVYIVTVPTPIDRFNRPDLTPLIKASETVGKVLKKGDIVIYESTVYPGCTEEDCVPVLERVSGLAFNRDFFCGYSPERINPGDKEHTLTKIKKVTSGSTPEVADFVDALYRGIITAGTHKASSIKVAEAAKIIENSQRDINIAFVNELALIFDRMGIDTLEVLEAAGTKWNFLPFRPGFVGGHCIGVDPFYLTHKAESLGYHPEVILAGRRINDNMPVFAANKLIKLMIRQGHRIEGSRVLVLGITFKENCPDIRNSKAVDLVKELQDFGCEVTVIDPWADPEEVHREYGLPTAKSLEAGCPPFEAVVLAVAHREFTSFDVHAVSTPGTVMFDIKGILPREKDITRL